MPLPPPLPPFLLVGRDGGTIMTSERVFFGSEIILEIEGIFYEWVNYSNLVEVDLYGIRKERLL